jgi:FkbM family methyltransferase
MNPPGWFLKMCIQRFGLAGGLHVYQQLKFSGAASFKLPGYTGKLHYRPHTADLVTFREIFLREAYRIPFPTTFNPQFIVDAGANIGFTSVFWANLYPQAQILALEPEPDNFSLLSKNASAYPAIAPLHAAIWKNENPVSVHDPGYGLRGYRVEQTNTDAPSTVPAFSIPALMKRFNWQVIDLLKMDIEGSEKEIFEADTAWLASVRCLVIELHDRMVPGCTQAVTKALSAHAFDGFTYQESHVFLNRELFPPLG